jgi:CheY-like chemotaxis protein
VQASEHGGLTFPAALRSILRQDPDVILVGEVRDRETAAIALQASLTGHLVLATLHTIDAAGAVTRLLDIGIEPYKVASALRGVVSQRLVRRLCSNCREKVTTDPPEELRKWLPADTETWRAVGCEQCANTGYRRRLAVTQVLISTPDVERRITAGEPPERIASAARDSGMRDLWEAAIDQVRKGETSIEEVLRALEPPVENAGGRPRPMTPISMSSIPASRATPRSHASGKPLAGESFELLDEFAGAETSAGKRILVVEDDGSLRAALRSVLEDEGFTVFEAADGTRAVAQVDRVGPDAVVLDINMPGLDGYGVLRQLRSRSATATLPILVLTANSGEESEVRAFELGANDFLVKPFRAGAISARLRTLIQKTKR